MQRIARKFIKIPVWPIILCLLLIGAGIGIYLYYEVSDPKLKALIGGVVAGVIAYIISFMLSIYEYRQIDKFRSFGIVEVLTDRQKRIIIEK